MAWWKQQKARLEALVNEYGPVAVGTYFGIFGLVLLGFYVAIELGFQPSGAVGGAGTFGAAYLATKVTQPIRIAAALALTPLVARLWRRLRG